MRNAYRAMIHNALKMPEVMQAFGLTEEDEKPMLDFLKRAGINKYNRLRVMMIRGLLSSWTTLMTGTAGRRRKTLRARSRRGSDGQEKEGAEAFVEAAVVF